ncbi:MAG: site-specific integrase [Mesorhizobium sp.]|nr:MAG: site-specific integrase [Mesorhizobium sp.]TIO24186.1 MAG: site-specific integrase [Mesorhizobium sp.]TJV64202.1 MAG: site-specific integrase [Mesorhizobium sp.]
MASDQGWQRQAINTDGLQGGGVRCNPGPALDGKSAGTCRLHRDRYPAEERPLHQIARTYQAVGSDNRHDPRLAQDRHGAVRQLHRQSGQIAPEVDPGARRGRLFQPRALDADRVGAGTAQGKKAILTTEHIAKLIAAAKNDLEQGIYYAFAFLAGTRPSEQLGLLWSEVDFERNVIRIRRIQERDGSLTEMTKTEAGTREIPMSAVLREMLLAWRVRCPRLGKELHRVFPGPGRLQEWPKPRIGGGGPLLYQNFRKRYWAPAFRALGLPYVTPHSARHSFISTLQAQGIEIGLVAQIAGHANPTVTLGHYTQAVRDGSAAIEALDRAYGG